MKKFLIPLCLGLTGCFLKKTVSGTKDGESSSVAKPAECQKDLVTDTSNSFECAAPIGYNSETQIFGIFNDPGISSSQNELALAAGLNLNIASMLRGSSRTGSKANETFICTCEAPHSDGSFIYVVTQNVDLIPNNRGASSNPRYYDNLATFSGCFDKAKDALDSFVRNGSSRWLGTRTDVIKDPQPDKALESYYCTTGNQACQKSADGTWLCRKKDVAGAYKDGVTSFYDPIP